MSFDRLLEITNLLHFGKTLVFLFQQLTVQHIHFFIAGSLGLNTHPVSKVIELIHDLQQEDKGLDRTFELLKEW